MPVLGACSVCFVALQYTGKSQFAGKLTLETQLCKSLKSYDKVGRL
jgi:hypothetical protein